MSGPVMDWNKPFNADLGGQQLSQILPQLTKDVRRLIAKGLSCTDQARCLLLTSSSLQHEGFKTLLEELKLVHKFWLLFGQLENVAEAGGLHAQATELPQAPVNANSRQACQAYLDAVQDHAHSTNQCHQRILQAFKALYADQQLKRLLEQNLSVAAKVARMLQVQNNDIYMKDVHRDFEEFSAAVQYLPM